MPRIKSPISQIERDYNLRYEVATQQLYLRMIDRRNLDRHADAFIQNCEFNNAAGNLILTERQADYLADIYSKHSS